MSSLKFNKNKIEILIRKSFPNSHIESYKQFSTGLVSPTFKVKIKNPSKTLVVKLGKLKNKNKFHQNNKILNYLNENQLPAPKVFFDRISDKKFITIMDYSSGEVASKIYQKAKLQLRKKILLDVGRKLKLIHSLEIPSFWVHQHHEVKNKKEWKKWTKLRIDKYLTFLKNKLSNYYDFLEKELDEFWQILEKEKIDFVPLHWDYHLHNLNVNSNGKVTGIFDFDNAMKGHSLADLGQSAYWLRFEMNDYKNFDSFLKGYKNKFTNKELKLIRGYYLLHLLAVTRSLWFKQKRLGWIIDKHKEILDEFTKQEF
jgi:aminoglycoside phosphotransferase (APT) family kinase protein|tara:strand:- start:66 stop:1004 length:939 start_codon:yes stop_codon:yes gene_type:complete